MKEATCPEYEFEVDHVMEESDGRLGEATIAYLKEVGAVVERLVITDEALFFVSERVNDMPCAGSYSLTGKMLKRLVENSSDIKLDDVQFINSHPYVKAYHDAVESFRLDEFFSLDPHDQVARLNAAVDKIRKTCCGPVMRQYMRKLDNAKKVRMKGAQKLVDALRDKYARLEVLRLDLSYRKGKYIDLNDFVNVSEGWPYFITQIVRFLSVLFHRNRFRVV